jgi:hypothetical protein
MQWIGGFMPQPLEREAAMARMTYRFASLAAIAAALSLAATPASAREWHRYHRGGVDGGDILAGALLFGGIVAIASAASKAQRDREVRENYPPPPPNPDERYDYQAPQSRDYRAGGLNQAVDNCVGEVERGNARVASVDNAGRTADGWHVSGQLDTGRSFDCSVGNDGRVRRVDVGNDRYSAYDRQQTGEWEDTNYSDDASDAEPAYDY